MKRIVCLGGGPAGLYSAILFAKALPRARIEVVERNRPDDTFGWGVVFSDKTMAGFRHLDPESHDAITGSFHHWDDIDVHFRGTLTRSGGHGFCGIERKRLLNILQQRAADLGVHHTFEQEVESEAPWADADLVVAADGVNSRLRTRHADVFRPDIDVRKCRYIWLGTTQKFPAFTFAFEQTRHGWFQIHAYQFSRELSTVIVETREETWLAHGLDRFDTAQSIAFCERLFASYLGGHALMSNARHLRGSAWLNFNRVLCQRWHTGNLVLIGDAAHTAHFGIGSGTKLAMEDAASLVHHVARATDVPGGLASYQAERSLEALKLQNAARNRMEWFENVARYVHLPPWQFAYSLLTGSQRIGHDNLRVRDAAYVGRVERQLAHDAGLEAPRPPMFLPLRLRGLQLENRVVVSPMAQYKAVDGLPGDWHLVHYGARATGGAGLVFTEMTCVSPEGRITPGCTGLWNEAQRDAWARIVRFVHAESRAKLCLQLGHSGRKGSTQLGWQQADHPLPAGNWPTMSASAIPWIEGVSPPPRAMTRADMDRVRDEFVHAARLGAEAGFDMLELHMAHGYLLASFLSPLTNRRTDEYGGDVAARLRYPLEVLRAVRAAWPADRPLSVRLSAADWAPGGLAEQDLVAIGCALRDAGADLLDVSTGQTVPHQKPVYGRMWQTPFSDLLRSAVGLPTIAVGNIFEADHVNTIVAAGRADLCALARPHLADPSWTLRAAAAQGHAAQHWPEPYLSGRAQLVRNLERAAQAGPV
ncbi:MAG: bifunctional salicylyl-CoA 5-hydroxylase/oxidoreductase [Steroidobacteraceae bacterium]|jgi:anthraniloyl-CoA monooxygenase|nr:bifunctional salicylyl-CoA 5-hydroxylase/oxidoreductase [Steroidobacteraceae bacterium]